MRLSKMFNKVLSLVLAGTMVLTGINVADTKKADAAGAVVEIRDDAGNIVTDKAFVSAFAEATQFVINDREVKTMPALGVDMAKLKEYVNDESAKVQFSGIGMTNWLDGGAVDKFSVDPDNPSTWTYFDQNTVAKQYAAGSKVLIKTETKVGDGLNLAIQKDSTAMSALKAKLGGTVYLEPGMDITVFGGVRFADSEVLGGFANNAGECWIFNSNWQSISGCKAVYDPDTQAFRITVDENATIPASGVKMRLWVQNQNASVKTEEIEVNVRPASDSNPALKSITAADLNTKLATSANFGQMNYTVTIIKETADPMTSSKPTTGPTKAPTSGSGISGSGSSGSGTSGAGTGEPVELPEADQFSAYIGVTCGSDYVPRAAIGENGYEIFGFDQEDPELPQTEMTKIDSTGVYSVALTGSTYDLVEGVNYFALHTDFSAEKQAASGIIVKPVEVVFGSETYTTFPMTAYIKDGNEMRYSFANNWGGANANPFDADQFAIDRGEGIYIKFVVAYSEEDAARLVENYDDADTYEEIQNEVKEAKEELSKKPTPAPTPTTKPDVKPTAKPTAKPTVAPTLKVAGKITMGAKEKVTVKATTNQASVKAVSSKTSAVKASASGRNIKLTAGKKAGSASITVTAGTKKASIKVTVKVAPKKIKAAKKTVNVGRGKKATTKVKFTPKKAAAYTIKVTNASQLKKKKVTVTVANGKITVKADKKAKKGTLTVKLQTYNKKKTTFKVKVK